MTKSFPTNFLEIIEKVTSTVDIGENMNIVFLDFEKAFNKVLHKSLLVKLRALQRV
jgi:hypothetical protein